MRDTYKELVSRARKFNKEHPEDLLHDMLLYRLSKGHNPLDGSEMGITINSMKLYGKKHLFNKHDFSYNKVDGKQRYNKRVILPIEPSHAVTASGYDNTLEVLKIYIPRRIDQYVNKLEIIGESRRRTLRRRLRRVWKYMIEDKDISKLSYPRNVTWTLRKKIRDWAKELCK